ncbi:hypothetical protein [Guptibacillus algicola]|uniref:hypothetical protein n=1 Tax=Guptibacillus algicola TaxID=225844 RepID=UPI001CD567D3|nr:hypothetical protein [Alkalihalobacillus algicola]MCA0987286.1 hypothetical protein [Alkalihalobacillus algicola]
MLKMLFQTIRLRVHQLALSTLTTKFEKSLGSSDEQGNYGIQVESGENRNIVF